VNHAFRILVVEDNPGDVDLIKDALDNYRYPLEVTVVNDGECAVEYLQRDWSDEIPAHRPDLMLLDLNLPKIGGLEVLKTARSVAALRTLPIIIFSSSDASRDIISSYGLGANCYLAKPGNLETFRTTLHAIAEFWLNYAKLP